MTLLHLNQTLRDSFMISVKPESTALSVVAPDIDEVAGVVVPNGFANRFALAGVLPSSFPIAARIIATWVSGK